MQLQEQITETLDAYLQKYMQADPRAAAAYYDLPYTLLERNGAVVFADSAALEERFATLMKQTATAGFTGARWARVEVRAIGAAVAMVDTELSWLDATGQEAARYRLTYALRKTDSNWKIALVIPHAD